MLEQKPRSNRPPASSKLKASKPVDPVEDQFWSTPGASAKPLHFSDNLLFDEEAEFGDLSMESSIMSPIPPSHFGRARLPSLSPDRPPPELPESPITVEPDGVLLPEPMLLDEHKVSDPEPEHNKAMEEDLALDTPRKVRVNMEVERAVVRFDHLV